MASIIEFIFGKTVFRIAFKILLFSLITALYITASTLFFTEIFSLILNYSPNSQISTFTYILAAMLPSNTLLFISTIFTAQFIAVTYVKTVYFIHSKRQIFGTF